MESERRFFICNPKSKYASQAFTESEAKEALATILKQLPEALHGDWHIWQLVTPEKPC